MAEQGLSNWGRWGVDDERGALNLLTPEVVKRAVGVVKRGTVYSLSYLWGHQRGPCARTSAPSRINPVVVGMPHYFGGRDVGYTEDTIVLNSHATTHVDALSHFWYGGALYNGVPSDCATAAGVSRLDVSKMEWMVGRGVLLDVARYKNTKRLEKGYIITPEDLEGTAKSQGVQVERGDILLIRTGHITLFEEDEAEFYRAMPNPYGHVSGCAEPGLGAATVPWLHEKDVCAIASDTLGVGVNPHESSDERFPWVIHPAMLRDQGRYLIELLWLEELAEDEVYESLFVAAPLRLAGAAGSPVNPLAIA